MLQKWQVTFLVFERLRRSDHYPALFVAAFGDTSISTRRFIDALVQFQLILISDNAKYDSVRRGRSKFTAQEKKGFKLFKRNCASCHKPPLFMNNDFTSNNLPIDSSLMDLGRYHVTHRPQDSLRFKTPSLRNIEYTYPYMHDGRFKTIYEVLDHYNANVMPLIAMKNRPRSTLLTYVERLLLYPIQTLRFRVNHFSILKGIKTKHMIRIPLTFLFATLAIWASAQSVTPPEMAIGCKTQREVLQDNMFRGIPHPLLKIGLLMSNK